MANRMPSGALPEHPRYRFEKCLRTSAVSQVYLAQPIRTSQDAVTLSQPVIVKSLDLSRLERWKDQELFEREMAVLEQLNHPQIPRYIEHFTPEEMTHHCFLVMERVPGQNLLELMASGWRPAVTQVFDVAAQALRILVYLQSLRPPVVHRDIKPSNLMWDQESETLYMIDFGAVQAAQQHGEQTIVGSFGYMAPEQYRGHASPASDLYGLGMTLIHILSGQSPETLPWQHAGTLQAIPDLTAIRGVNQLSAVEQAWLRFLIAPEASERYATAEAALADWVYMQAHGTLQKQQTSGANLKAGLVQTQRSQQRLWLWGGLICLSLGLIWAGWQSHFMQKVGLLKRQSAVIYGEGDSCFTQEVTLPEPDNSPDAQRLREAWLALAPLPDHWQDIKAPWFSTDTQLGDYWRCRMRPQDGAFAKAAYQSLINFPQNTDLVIKAINLMPHDVPADEKDADYLVALLEEGLQRYGDYQTEKQGSDTAGGLVRHLMAHYLRLEQPQKAEQLAEDFFAQHGADINPHMYQLLSLQWADALALQSKTAQALRVLDEALKKPGSWNQKIQKRRLQIIEGVT